MNIFLTNDDGIMAEGIRVLAKELSKQHNVLVIAPATEKSASSHSLTIRKSMSLKKVDFFGLEAYSLEGNPADCVKFLLLHFTGFKPDMVISGINRGGNMGRDVHYSGTVSAAMEGAILGTRSVAVSSFAHEDNEYQTCASFVSKHIDMLYNLDYHETAYSINVPNLPEDEIKGYVFSKLGDVTFDDRYISESEGTYTLAGEPIAEFQEGTDVWYVNHGYIAVTPLMCNLTNFPVLEKLPRGIQK